jgi:hypothetical protein
MMAAHTLPPVASGTYGHGSFGYQSTPPGTTMTLWSCGVWIVKGLLQNEGPGYIGNTSELCMHRTRAQARACRNRAAYLRTGAGTLEPTGPH